MNLLSLLFQKRPGRTVLTGEFRLVFIIVVAVLSTFGVLLFFFPAKASGYWPWVFSNVRSASLVGGVYLAAAVYYVLALQQDDWLQARNGVGGLIIFSLVLLAATAFHWDQFRPYHPVTFIWLILYYGPPLLIPILYRSQAEGQGDAAAIESQMGLAWRFWLGGRGFFYLILAVGGLMLAGPLSTQWPWTINPLEVRVFMGQLAINGWGGPVALKDSGWRNQRLGLVLTGTMGLVQLLGLAITSAPYDLYSPPGIILPIMFTEWLATSVLALWGNWNK